jgi:integrase
MARPPREPSYCHHKPSHLGYAKFRRPDGSGYDTVYFPGAHGSAESRAAYHAALHAWAQGRPVGGRRAAKPASPIVGDLAAEFLRIAPSIYVKGGRPTSELRVIQGALAPLLELFAELPTADYGLAQQDALRAALTRRPLARGSRQKTLSASTVAHYLARVRSLFRWGEGRGLVPRGTAAGLAGAGGLGSGGRRRAATAAGRPRPADLFAVGCVQLCAPPPVRAMIWLGLLNGMRPGGVVALRPCDVDRRGPLWLYREPVDQAAKTGGEVHWLGARAQAILGPWLDAAPAPDAPVFAASQRPWMRRRRGYSVGYYRETIHVVCDRLGVPRFGPHSLRHNHATLVRRQFGLEAARARLGHAASAMTLSYAEPDYDLVKKIAEAIG